MGHESVLAALNALSKKRVFDRPPEEHILHIAHETARSGIILVGSTVEHTLQRALEFKMPGLNGEETNRIFGPEGPLGTFANKIRLAKALGIIGRPDSKKIDVVRAMRNAAAHCVEPISFGAEAFRDGTLQLISTSLHPKLANAEPRRLRICFEFAAMGFCNTINGRPRLSDAEIVAKATGTLRPEWLDKLEE